MSKKWQKRIDKLDNKLKLKLLQVSKDIMTWNFVWYNVKKLVWFSDIFRIRVGDIRIVFKLVEGKWKIEKIDFRWDIYKSL